MKVLVVSLSLFLGVFQLNAQNTKDHLNIKRGLAIQGYDPVSYFNQEEPSEGSKNIQASHNGATYYFVSEANKKAFLSKPSKYEPQYGGYCAYAMADGEKVKIDPETFKIIDDKLYLFYNFWGTNTLKLWNNDEGTLLPKADRAWTNIIKN